MPDPRVTHYEVLGVPRDARPVDIQRVYDQFVADLPKAETPPDPRRERRMRDAYAVLSDPAQREAYDASLADAARAEAKRRRGIAMAAGSAVVALVAGLFGWNALKSSVKPSSPVAARPVAEIAAEAGRALGRVEAYDLSGQVTPLGFGAAVEAGTMVVACPALGAGAQIKVHNGPRAVSARVTHKSEPLGLCRIAVEGSGAASPLPVANAVPGVGDKVFAATLDAAGEARLAEGKVKRVWTEGARTLVESTGMGTGAEGAVLLDAAGRVLGVAPGITPVYYAVTRAFVAERSSGT
jgi:hypothetical protein